MLLFWYGRQVREDAPPFSVLRAKCGVNRKKKDRARFACVLQSLSPQVRRACLVLALEQGKNAERFSAQVRKLAQPPFVAFQIAFFGILGNTGLDFGAK